MRSSVVGAAMLALACVAALWPWRATLNLVPTGGDAARWLMDGAWDNPEWPTWVFLSRHFVGWRPFAALSYTAVDALLGGTPLAHHGTDLALFGATGFAAYAAARFGLGVAPGPAACAAVVTWCHPMAVHIVPFESRRSYLLAVLAGLLSVGARRRPAVFVPLLAAALLSNEVAFAAVLPLALLADGRAKILPVAVAALALVGRVAVLGGLGGYAKRYAAVQQGETLGLSRTASWSDAVAGAFQTALAPVGLDGAPPAMGAVAVAALLIPLAVVAAARRDRAVAAVTAWFAALMLIYAVSETWFWRMGYPMVPLLGLGAALGLDALRQSGWTRRLGVGLPAAVAAMALAARSPAVVGLDRAPFAERRAVTKRYVATVAAMSTLPAQGAVVLAFPLDMDDGVLFRASLTRSLSHREAKVTLLTVSDHVPERWMEGEPWVAVRGEGREARAVLRSGMRLTVVQQRRLRLSEDAREVPLRRIAYFRRATRLVWPTASGIAYRDLP